MQREAHSIGTPMSQQEIKHSALVLKKAVPLMMQHKVATTPQNYALWYTYVEQTNSQLNQAMDEIISQHGHCTPSSTSSLYQTHFTSAKENELDALKQSLESMTIELSNTVHSTLSDSNSFSQTIDNSFSNLEKVEIEGLSMDDVMGVVRQLVEESKTIRSATRFFNNQLNTATAEINKLKQQLAEVQQQVMIDSLSGLNNRRAYDQDIEMLCEQQQTFCVVLLDLDHFKQLNDEYSHLLGDAVIRAVAKRLQDVSRDGVTAYRYGGEEFALIVPNQELRRARHFAESVRRLIEKIAIKDKQSGKNVSSITASFGVAQWQTNDTPAQLTARADQQLYEAKQLGRNRVMPL